MNPIKMKISGDSSGYKIRSEAGELLGEIAVVNHEMALSMKGVFWNSSGFSFVAGDPSRRLTNLTEAKKIIGSVMDAKYGSSVARNVSSVLEKIKELDTALNEIEPHVVNCANNGNQDKADHMMHCLASIRYNIESGLEQCTRLEEMVKQDEPFTQPVVDQDEIDEVVDVGPSM